MLASGLRGRSAVPQHARCHRAPVVGRIIGGRRFSVLVKASTEENQEQRIKRTLEGLDALLGIDPNDPKAGTGSSASTKSATAVAESVSSDAARAASSTPASTSGVSTSNGNGASSSNGASEDQFQKIVEKARQLADAQRSGKSGNVEAQQQQLRQEFETLLTAMSKGNDMLDKEDMKRLKEAAFGPQTFWVRGVSA